MRLLLWFIGGSWLLVHAVFQSPALDYRLVVLGAVLPLLDELSGGAWVLHSLLFSVVLLGVVMLATRRRRLVRRRWLGLPIGIFVHLVLDGVWANSAVFWWPFLGWSFRGSPVPEFDRGPLVLLFEALGAAAIVFGWQRFGLREPGARRRFLMSGQLPR